MRDEKNIVKMIETIDKITRYCFNKSYGDFVEDEMLTEACVFNLSQLGETSHKISNGIIR